MRKGNKFTVIVPTRERADVLGPALRTIVDQDYDNLAILVSDNFSNDSTRDVVESFNDPRIIYVNTGKRLSMSHNWEFALTQMKDGWVAFIGDDDGLLPGSIARAAEIAREYGVKAIGSRNAAYTWPDPCNQKFGSLSVSLKRGVEVFDSKARLMDIVHGHGTYGDLPMLYTGGFVDFGVIEQARAIDGTFNHSICPDVYSAVAVAKLTDRFVYSNEPLAIGGSSKHSGGTSYSSGGITEKSSDSPAKKFFSESNTPFHQDLVSSNAEVLPPSIELMVYEAILQAEYIPPSFKALTSHAEQLAILIGKAKSRHRQEITAWGKRLAERYDLNFQAIQRKARRIMWQRKLKKNLLPLFKKKSVLDITGTEAAPIRDVHEASRVIHDVLLRHHKG
jgi:glycosyltransferase involved in cell wall biosynthesis